MLNKADFGFDPAYRSPCLNSPTLPVPSSTATVSPFFPLFGCIIIGYFAAVAPADAPALRKRGTGRSPGTLPRRAWSPTLPTAPPAPAHRAVPGSDASPATAMGKGWRGEWERGTIFLGGMPQTASKGSSSAGGKEDGEPRGLGRAWNRDPQPPGSTGPGGELPGKRCCPDPSALALPRATRRFGMYQTNRSPGNAHKKPLQQRR